LTTTRFPFSVLLGHRSIAKLGGHKWQREYQDRGTG
jgi:hypothetical protein